MYSFHVLKPNMSLLVTDQRGDVRNGVCDMGADEYNSAGTPTPTNTPLPPSASSTPTNTMIAPSATLSAVTLTDYLPLILRSSFPVMGTSMSTPTVIITATAQTPTPTATKTPTPTATATKTATPTQNVPLPFPTPTALEDYGYVTIVDYAFQPAVMTIHVGAIVEWENIDPVDHTATSDTGVWDSGTLAPNQKLQFQFTAAGNYPYHCSFHPDMTGMIIVVP
jgi:plastocyanin